jgi:predicted permease
MRRFLLRLAAFFRSGHAEAELAREVNAHLRLLEDQFIAQGMSAEDARYAARRAFGGVEQVKERQRDARSFRVLDGLSLDLRLGLRMLLKYPGLTLVGGLTMAFAIAVGAASFEFLTQLTSPTLPLEGGDRIVGIRNRDLASKEVNPRALHDFAVWREQLTSIEHVGAFRTVQRNVGVDGGVAEPAFVAEISASAFQLTNVTPLLGRTLTAADERPGAPLVAVVGEEVWQRRLGGDPAVIGRRLRVGGSDAHVVGVMPASFRFPVADNVWIPLRLDVLDYERGSGPAINVFGRLVNGAGQGEAQAELSALGARVATDYPVTNQHLRPEVLPFGEATIDVGEMSLGVASATLLLLLLLILVCTNVALLMFARAVTREAEIVVRTALGASRGRIVMQLFAEALVLGVLAAMLGLFAARATLELALATLNAEAGGRLPFWLTATLSPGTLLYAGALAVLGAAVAGVIPALKVTGRRVEAQLRQTTTAGADVRFGGIWTGIIVTQVAVTLTFPAAAFFARQYVSGMQSLDVGFPAAEYLSTRLDVERDAGSDAEAPAAADVPRLRASSEELARRAMLEPAVSGITFTDRLPRTVHPERPIEVDGVEDPSLRTRVTRAAVAINYFDVLGAPVLAGRGFHSGDAGAPASPVIVNRSFVERVLGGRNATGVRLRYAGRADQPPSRWFEIVGVVKDLGMVHDNPREGAGVYHPAAPGTAAPLYALLHVTGDPTAFAPRLRALAAAVDPSLQLHDVLALDTVGETMWLETAFLFRLLLLVSTVALVLSLAGIYSVMSFAVSRRTREIGIRIALGANARRVVMPIFSRALAQVGLGIAAGGVIVTALTNAISGLSATEIAGIAGYMVLMTGVCLLACVVPTRRALEVQPTEVLKEG